MSAHDASHDAEHGANTAPSTRALEAWSVRHAGVMLIALAGSAALGTPWLLVLAGVGGLSTLLLVHDGWLAATGFGSANVITSLRVLACALLPTADALVPHGSALIALLTFSLDGVDGWLARRTHHATAFGARYDMECDAFFVTVASLTAVLHGHVGSYLLAMGALRYAYVLTLAALSRSDAEAPRTRLGRYVFAIVALSLCAALWPLSPIHEPLAAVALGLLVLSFARSFAWSVRAARTAR